MVHPVKVWDECGIAVGSRLAGEVMLGGLIKQRLQSGPPTVRSDARRRA
jgi:hypothetical protein